eukprot:7341419-Ditylum_brightwellii.AAC.1
MAGILGRKGEFSPETKQSMTFLQSKPPPAATIIPPSSPNPLESVKEEGRESIATTIAYEGTGGCLSCGADDDHANLLICEACNGEFHTYCLDPPLRCVPDGDFYC